MTTSRIKRNCQVCGRLVHQLWSNSEYRYLCNKCYRQFYRGMPNLNRFVPFEKALDKVYTIQSYYGKNQHKFSIPSSLAFGEYYLRVIEEPIKRFPVGRISLKEALAKKYKPVPARKGGGVICFPQVLSGYKIKLVPYSFSETKRGEGKGVKA